MKGDYGARGRFSSKARASSWEMFTDRHRDALYTGAALALGVTVLHQLAKKYRF